MRTTLKIILPLIVSVATVSLFFAAYQVRTEKSALRSDLSHRAEILGESLQESVEPLLDRAADKSLQRLVERFGQREHLKGVAVYSKAAAVLAITSGLPPALKMRPTAATRAAQEDTGVGEFLSAEQTAAANEDFHSPIHIYALPLHHNGEIAGTLVLFHDTGHIDRQVSRTLRDSLLNALVQTFLITGLAVILVQWTFTGPLTRTAKWLRTLRTGQANAPPAVSNGEILDEIHHEVKHLARDLDTARAAAEEEARLRDSSASLWTAERLHVSLRNKLREKPLYVVSNREPYMHVFSENEKSINIIVPASGVAADVKLVLAGPLSSAQRRVLLATADAAGVAERLKLLGYIDERYVPVL